MYANGTGQLILGLIIFFIFIILPALLDYLNKQRRAQRKRQTPPSPTGSKKVAYQASDHEIKRYLATVRGEQAPKPKGPAPAMAQTTRRTTTRRGPSGVTVTTTETTRAPASPVEEVKRYLESIGVRVGRERQVGPAPRREAPPPARPPQAKPRRRPPAAAKAPPPSPAPQEVPEPVLLEAVPAAAATAHAALGRKPTREELRRAVILSEIIRRPDFRRIPWERAQF